MTEDKATRSQQFPEIVNRVKVERRAIGAM
jgi:hypothetical protein